MKPRTDLIDEMHPTLSEAFDFADRQVKADNEYMRIVSSFVTVAGAMVFMSEKDNPNKDAIIEHLVTLLRAASYGPEGATHMLSLDRH